jgi:type IV pilus assembly protein PilO
LIEHKQIIDKLLARPVLMIGSVLLVLIYTVGIRGLQKKLVSAKEQATNTAKLLRVEKKKIQKAKHAQQKVEELQGQYAAKPNHAGDVFSFSDVLSDLEKAASNSRIALQRLELQENKETELFVEHVINIEVKGTYKNLLSFINGLFGQPGFITLKELALQQEGAGVFEGRLVLRALMVVHESKAFTKRVASIKPSALRSSVVINIPGRNIFLEEKIKQDLSLWRLSELFFLGTIKQGKEVVGFVGDPVGGVHQVVVGNKAGLEQSKIIKIDEGGVATVALLIGRNK